MCDFNPNHNAFLNLTMSFFCLSPKLHPYTKSLARVKVSCRLEIVMNVVLWHAYNLCSSMRMCWSAFVINRQAGLTSVSG